MTEFVVIIPARMGSTRLPGKALLDICGKPMVVRTAEQAHRSQARAVYVATDHESVAQAVRQAGFQAIMTSPDHVSGTDRLAEAVHNLGLPDDTIVVNVQGDEPLIDPALINALAAELAADPALPMATACHALHDMEQIFNPNVVKVVLGHNNDALYFSRAPIPFARDAFAHNREALPEGLPAYRHIGIYAYRTHFLRTYQALPACPLEQFEALEQLRVQWHGYRIGVHIAVNAPAAGVDTQADLDIVRALMAAMTTPQEPV